MCVLVHTSSSSSSCLVCAALRRRGRRGRRRRSGRNNLVSIYISGLTYKTFSNLLPKMINRPKGWGTSRLSSLNLIRTTPLHSCLKLDHTAVAAIYKAAKIYEH